MASIKYSRFNRILTRCTEVGTAKAAKATVAGIHKDVLRPPSSAFQTAHAAVRKAESASAKASAESGRALQAFDGIYAEARLVVLTYVPTVKVAETLKQQSTDTDKVEAIQILLDTLDENKAEAWAQVLLNGDFGTQAQGVIEKLSATVAAGVALTKARAARAEAYDPVYEKYLAFKRLVRKVYGQHSKEYQRIHIRAQAAGAEEEEEEEQGEAPATPEPSLPSTG